MYVRTHMSESLVCAYVLIINTTALLLARLYYTYVHNHISVAQTPACEHVYICVCVCVFVCTYVHVIAYICTHTLYIDISKLRLAYVYTYTVSDMISITYSL